MTVDRSSGYLPSIPEKGLPSSAPTSFTTPAAVSMTKISVKLLRVMTDIRYRPTWESEFVPANIKNDSRINALIRMAMPRRLRLGRSHEKIEIYIGIEMMSFQL